MSEQTENNLSTIVDTKNVSLIDTFKNDVGDFLLSLYKEEELDLKKLTYNAMNGGTIRLSDMKDKVISIRGVLLHPLTLTDEVTGEVTQKIRMVIIDENGSLYGTGSRGIERSLKTLFMSFGMPNTWTSSIKCKVTEKENKKNFKYLSLEMV